MTEQRITIRLTLVALLALAVAPSTAAAQTYLYDEAGRLVRVLYAQGNGVGYQYDASDNLTGVFSIALPIAPSQLKVTRISPTSARLTWQDMSNNETGFVIMRKLAGTNAWETIATAPAGSTEFTDSSLNPSFHYVYRVAAQGTLGLSAYSNEDSSASNASVDLSLRAGGAVTASTVGTGEVQSGYASVDVDFGKAPYGTAVFSLQQNGEIVSEVGVPASPPTQSARIFIDYRQGVAAGSGTIDIYTGLAAVNFGNRKASVAYTLRDLGGNTLAAGNGTLDIGIHFAKFIHELREVAPDFDLPSDFPVAKKFGTLDISSDQPMSIVALRLTSNQRGETLLTTTPIADLNKPSVAGPAFFPQFVDGGGYISSIVMMNTSTTRMTGSLEIFGDNGSPLSIRPVGGSSGSAFPYVIEGGGSALLESDGSSSQLVRGWVRLTPDPGSQTPSGAGLFRFTQNGVVVTESGVPSANPTTLARIYIDKSFGHDTGLAIANPGSALMKVALSAFQADGSTQVGTNSVDLGARGHTAQFAGELITGLPDGFTGVLEISSQIPFVALTLRSLINGRREFLLSTFPIADLNQPAPSPVVFPQIADGGGYTTQLILLSSGGRTETTIRFFGNDRMPLSVIRK